MKISIMDAISYSGLVVMIILTGFILYGTHSTVKEFKEKDTWPECELKDHPKHNDEIYVKSIGNFKYEEEICSIEEVVYSYGSFQANDEKLKCKYEYHQEKLLMRRMVCPSNISSSTIREDVAGNKNKKYIEVIE
jgi:hypothetical protein